MDKNKLRSDIKAYALEIMKEMSTSGGAGAYLTKLKGRKVTSKDLKSPTGFESGPKENMYTKTMKFKIVKPDSRINSKDLWSDKKGQPKFDSTIKEGVDPSEIPSQDLVTNSFEKWGREIHYLYWKPVEEWDEYDLSNWKSLVAKDGKYNFPAKELREVRYSRFKKETERRTPREQLHKAVREIQMKMDEVNKLVDFTSKMRQELKENEDELKYLKRTKNSLYKIQEKIQFISNKIKQITE